MTARISDHVARFVETKRALGYRFTQNELILKRFARFAEARGETFIRAATVLEWASASRTASSTTKIRLLRFVHDLALWLHAEDERHEVPHRDALGRRSSWRPRPFPMSVPDIRKLLDAALSRGPAGTIAPLTWHYMFGLMASTGLRIGEALALTLEDVTDDGLVIRDTKFGKTRLVVLHPTSRTALDLYLAARLRERTPDRHLFVIATGRPPRREHADVVFRELAERAGLRKPGERRGPTPHSLRHAFAIRSLENIPPGARPGRHMLALSTTLGHAELMSTFWYLEATPVLLRGIAEATERAFVGGGSDD